MEKIKYQEIRFENFKLNNDVEDLRTDVFTKFLFNGSRKVVIDKSVDELMMMFKQNNTFLSYLKDNIHGILDAMNISLDERYKKIRYLYRVDIYDEISNFKYGDLYLSTNFLCAITFSALVGGELYELAYACAIDIKKLGIVFSDDEINLIMENIINNYYEYEKSEKVILAVKNVDFNDLKTESGSEYTEDFLKEYLYENEVTLSVRTNKNVRLSNLNKYTFYLIHEDEFLKFIPLFTNIKEGEVAKLKFDDLDFLFD